VLKITTIRENDESVRVCLCGQLTSEYVPELEKAMTLDNADKGKLALDMSNVTFVDREAMVFLCAAKSRNVAIENVPSYVMRWIEQERRCGPTFPECTDK
jgi:ABC-type transporter Mla MlaB component